MPIEMTIEKGWEEFVKKHPKAHTKIGVAICGECTPPSCGRQQRMNKVSFIVNPGRFLDVRWRCPVCNHETTHRYVLYR